ncbi:hypothetical protein NC651_023216 [Populus alba x Populus x berolinensis]|nr:hypothetical protein NC651_023216 [Populus alba x Populus x berolinensis]
MQAMHAPVYFEKYEVHGDMNRIRQMLSNRLRKTKVTYTDTEMLILLLLERILKGNTLGLSMRVVPGVVESFKSSGCVSPTYMDRQFDINEKMRAILVDWLIEVHYKFELMDETLFLAINLIDRFLERCTVVRKKLQLVGVTAMLLACKYEEVSVPLVEDFVLISDNAYTRIEVLDMEKLMVNTLQFKMSVPTPYMFMKRFLKAALSDKKLELLSFFIIEVCLVEYEMLRFPPSLLAAAAIYTAQCSLYQFKQWSKTSEWHTSYTEDQLLECSRMMVSFHQKAGYGKLTGVHRKYSTSKFGYAAKAEPALFLLGL